MKSITVATAAVVATTLVVAQNSSLTVQVTSYYNTCSSFSELPTVTATDIETYCPICEEGGMTTYPGGSITVYETILQAECTTGPSAFEDKTYTVTEPCPSTGLDRSADHLPQGFTVKSVPCGCAESTSVPITAPGPALASAAAKKLPTVATVVPTPAAAGAPAGAPANAPAGAPAAAPAPTGSGASPAPANAPAGSNSAPEENPASGGSSPAPAPASASTSPGEAPASGSSSPASGEAPAGAGTSPGEAPASGISPPSEAGVGSSPGAPAAKYPLSPAAAPGSASPSGAPASNGTTPFLGAAAQTIPQAPFFVGLIALVAAFRVAV